MTSLSYRKKKKIIERDGIKCTYCGKACKDDEIHLDHIIPSSKGGAKYSSENLVISCCKCNQFKRDLTPTEFLIKAQNKAQKLAIELKYWRKIIKHISKDVE